MKKRLRCYLGIHDYGESLKQGMCNYVEQQCKCCNKKRNVRAYHDWQVVNSIKGEYTNTTYNRATGTVYGREDKPCVYVLEKCSVCGEERAYGETSKGTTFSIGVNYYKKSYME